MQAGSRDALSSQACVQEVLGLTKVGADVINIVDTAIDRVAKEYVADKAECAEDFGAVLGDHGAFRIFGYVPTRRAKNDNADSLVREEAVRQAVWTEVSKNAEYTCARDAVARTTRTEALERCKASPQKADDLCRIIAAMGQIRMDLHSERPLLSTAVKNKEFYQRFDYAGLTNVLDLCRGRLWPQSLRCLIWKARLYDSDQAARLRHQVINSNCCMESSESIHKRIRTLSLSKAWLSESSVLSAASNALRNLTCFLDSIDTRALILSLPIAHVFIQDTHTLHLLLYKFLTVFDDDPDHYCQASNRTENQEFEPLRSGKIIGAQALDILANRDPELYVHLQGLGDPLGLLTEPADNFLVSFLPQDALFFVWDHALLCGQWTNELALFFSDALRLLRNDLLSTMDHEIARDVISKAHSKVRTADLRLVYQHRTLDRDETQQKLVT